MTDPEAKKKKLIDQVLERAREHLPADQAAQAEGFIRNYYFRAAPEDLLDHAAQDLYGAAISHWHLALRRAPGEHLVRVYNPRMEAHGWHSTHTIVEVVHPDIPFLVDSVRMLLNRHGLTVHLIIHPVMHLKRDDHGQLLTIHPEDATDPESAAESLMHFEVDRQGAETLQAVEDELHEVLEDVETAVADWKPMQRQLEEVIETLRRQRPPVDSEDFDEDLAFLEWIAQDHFTFLGYREYRLEETDGEDELALVPGSGLGILRWEEEGALSQSFSRLPPEVRRLARHPDLLILTKSNSLATVHRPAYMDYIGIKQVDADGTVRGEWRFLGLYTSAAYNRSTQEIPLLRRKVRQVLECSGLRPEGHSSKALMDILETLPRGELFQSGVDELCATTTGILHLQERQRVRMFVRRDPYQRYLACLVYLPREHYDTTVRMRIQELLREAFDADSVDFTVYLSASVLARLYLIVHTRPGHLPDYDIVELEGQILETTRTWEDGLKDNLLAELGEERGNRLFQRYQRAFPGSYRDDYSPAIAVLDVTKMEALESDNDLGMTLYRPLEAPANALRFKLFRRHESISLSLVLPMLENMGVRVVDQRPHRIRPEGNGDLWVQDIGMTYHRPGQLETERISQIFQEAFEQVWREEMENDGFNQLVLEAHMGWRDVTILRTYCKYLLQTGFPFSQPYMERTMANQPQIASLLVSLFHAYFTPEDRAAWQERAASMEASIQHSLDAVPSLDEDRILRRFFTLLKATLRTNFFQEGGDGRPKEYLAVKLDPTLIPDLDPPRPAYEVFVYSPRTAGIHLRGGKVARGGIRWSDRLEDFRTEVFGLMKAQTVKNAVIVPVGAKGGFVVKRPPASDDRQALMDEAVHCYSTFIRGLLDLTDNLDGAEVVPPPRVVRYDDDDPYLVVAADKGTATFSDTANAIAAEYDYWLGDAFASGGSSGYDHKKMGITARGAWESVKRHFRELGTDIQNEDFTVVGIGGMAGDVFGNGMLLSRHIRLIGAFSHREIFLDPDPDAEASFRERERLFHLPRASWADYDPDLISEGGGVFSRGAKSIPLAPSLQKALGVAADQLTPDEVIQALLRAPVDLLWNGGIGTFVKASTETHDDADDRANDNIRADATELRCKVIGEGGNLGMTQNGRIEFARRGGRVNTDFIDNSGGVDCSDHEVNIKVLLDQVVRDGDLSGKHRNQLLEQMTDEVADLVLRNNYLQTEALSMAEIMAEELFDEHVNFMHALEKGGRLERATWYLPDDEALAERRAARQGLARPELAVLLAYSKIDLFDALLDSDVCEDPYLSHELVDYFPAPIQERYKGRLADHRLRREIIATFIANSVVNRMGITFISQMRDQTGATASDIARAYTVTRRVFDLRELWHQVSALDNQVASEHQLDMLREARKLVRRASLWFLRNRRQPVDIAAAIDAFESGIQSLRDTLPELLDAHGQQWLQEQMQWHRENGVPEKTAQHFAELTLWVAGLDIVQVATLLELPEERVARYYFAVGARLELDWLRDRIAELPREEHWAHLARAALRDDLARQQCAITFAALKEAPDAADPDEGIARWEENNRTTVDRFLQRMAEFRAGTSPDLALLSVALNEVHKLVPNAQVADGGEKA